MKLIVKMYWRHPPIYIQPTIEGTIVASGPDPTRDTPGLPVLVFI